MRFSCFVSETDLGKYLKQQQYCHYSLVVGEVVAFQRMDVAESAVFTGIPKGRCEALSFLVWLSGEMKN